MFARTAEYAKLIKMALFIRQDEQRSELQEKIAAELQARMDSSNQDPPTEVGTAILDDSKEATDSSFLAVAVVALVVFVVVVFILFIFKGV